MGVFRLRWCPYAPYVYIPPYVQRVLIGYLFIYIIKCFPNVEAVMGVVRLRGFPYAPYVHILPVCFDAPICVDIPLMFGCPRMFRCPQMYGGIQTMGVSKHMGHPNICRIQTYRGHINTGGIWTPPKSDNPP